MIYRLIDEPRWDYRVIHADLQHRTEPPELITELVVQLARDDRLTEIVNALSYFPKKLWSGFRRTFEEVELYKFKVKLREQLRPRWQESGEELFRKIGDHPEPVVFVLDEFPMMIDFMARADRGRDEAKTLLRWFRALRMAPDFKNVRFLLAGSIGIGHVLSELGETSAINDFEQLRLEPFPLKMANSFVDALSNAHQVSLSKASKREMLNLIGTQVPYFIQIMFSEVSKAYKQHGGRITPKKVEQIYHEKVLGVDCKTYFEHYYGRLRDYYRPAEEKVIKKMLRQLATSGALKRDYCYQLYRGGMGDAPEVEEFNRVMTNLENDFYVRFDQQTSNFFEFASKLLRDWWLRHYGLEANS